MRIHDPRPDPLRAQFAEARAALSAALIDREEEIDLVLTALLAGEHVLLVGPPGCGKSLLLDALLSWTGGTKFSILFTKFTVPEEICGPVSLRALKEDKYVRVTAGKLPEADLLLPRRDLEGVVRDLEHLAEDLEREGLRRRRRGRAQGAAEALRRGK